MRRALVLLALCAAPLAAQVPASLTFANGEAEGVLRNPSATPLQVTLNLFWATEPGGHVVLGRPVRARISPRTTTLAPFQSQTFRIRLGEPVARGTVLRLETVFTPLDTPPAKPTATRGVQTRLVLVTRLLTKAVVP